MNLDKAEYLRIVGRVANLMNAEVYRIKGLGAVINKDKNYHKGIKTKIGKQAATEALHGVNMSVKKF